MYTNGPAAPGSPARAQGQEARKVRLIQFEKVTEEPMVIPLPHHPGPLMAGFLPLPVDDTSCADRKYFSQEVALSCLKDQLRKSLRLSLLCPRLSSRESRWSWMRSSPALWPESSTAAWFTDKVQACFVQGFVLYSLFRAEGHEAYSVQNREHLCVCQEIFCTVMTGSLEWWVARRHCRSLWAFLYTYLCQYFCS